MQQKNKRFLALLLSGSILTSIITLPKETYADENKVALEDVQVINKEHISERDEEDSLLAFEKERERINEYHKEVLNQRALELNEMAVDNANSLTELQEVEYKTNIVKEVGTYEEFVNEIQNGTSDIIKLKNDIATESEENLYIERAIIIDGNNKSINYVNDIPTIYIRSNNITVKNLNIEGNSIKDRIVFYLQNTSGKLENIILENINIDLRSFARNASIVSANWINNLTIKNVEQRSGMNYGWNNHIEIFYGSNVNIITNVNNSSVKGGKVFLKWPEGDTNITFTGDYYNHVSELLTILDNKNSDNSNYIKYNTEGITLRKEESVDGNYKYTSYAIKGDYDKLVNEANNKIKNLYNTFMNNKTIDNFFDYAHTASSVEDCLESTDSISPKYAYTHAENNRMFSAYKKYGENYFFESPWSDSTLDKQLSTVSNTNCIVYTEAYHIYLDELKSLCENNNTITILNGGMYQYSFSIDDIEILKKALSRDEPLFYSLSTSTILEDGALGIYFTMVDREFIEDNNYKFNLNIKSFREFRGRNMTLYGVDYYGNEFNLGKVKISDSGSLNITADSKYTSYLLREDNTISRMPFKSNSLVKYTGEWNKYLDRISTSDTNSSIEYTFYGTGIRLNGFNKENSGKIRVELDGKDMGIVDLNPYRNINTIGYINGLNVVYSIYNLNKGFHTIKLKSIIEEGEEVSLKGLDIEVEGESDFKRIEENSEYILKNGTWNTITDDRYSAGAKIEATKEGDSIEFTFDGTAIRLLGDYGECRFAKITLDGESEIVSFYESSMGWYYTEPQSIIYEKINLTPGKHTIKIEALKEGEFTYPWTGYINIDAFEIIGTPIKLESNKNTWKSEDGNWYYYDESGNKSTGWKAIDNTWYYFNNNGVMQTGWLNIGGTWYFLNESGAMLIGWQSIGGVWYHFDNSGCMSQGWLNDGGTWYFLSDSGAMLTGWQSIEGAWYHFDNSGCMSKGWLNDGGTWYFLSDSGAMLTGWQSIGGAWYFLNDSGIMLTGWQSIAGTWYHFNNSGCMSQGWLNDGGTWYYLYESGAMATNIVIDGWIIDGNGVANPQ